jgi:CubicO group peptidase (beta-lactamase class C family)
LAREALFAPAGAADTGFRPPSSLKDRIAPTEMGNAREREMAGPAGDGFPGWRTYLLQGECHDLNAWTLGGVSGNAGLFSTCADLHRLALEHLGAGRGVLDEAARRLLRTDLTPGLTENRSVGWQLAASPGSSAGPFLSPGAMGHTGFTGTSIWIDPENGWILVLLTNRVHPRYRPHDMNAVRRRFHQRALDAASTGTSS